jgi:hypothetical protein
LSPGEVTDRNIDLYTVISMADNFLKNYAHLIELAEQIWYFSNIKA